MAKLFYQGHGSYRITSDHGCVAYIDPFAGGGYDVPADLILVTHEHSDHNQVQLVPRKPSCRIFRAKDVLVNGSYLTHTVGGFTFTAVPAQNANHPVDQCVGFLIQVDGKKIYGAGDTSTTRFMEGLFKQRLDWALLPIDGVYNMGPTEASTCASLIQACRTIPIHMKPGKLYDDGMAAAFHCDGKTLVRPGEEIEL